MHVFISRDLLPGSIFRARLLAAGHQVTGRSLIDFEAVPVRSVPPADWIFFYSRRAVHFFLDQITTLPKGVKLAALGQGTASALREHGYRPDFTGSGQPASVAEEFGAIAAGQRVLFPRARHSRQSVQHFLGRAVDAVDLIVYDNRPSDTIPDASFDVLVFTSPMNAQAYFRDQKPTTGQRILAIGNTTAAALRKLQIERVEVAPEPSEEGMAKAVLGEF